MTWILLSFYLGFSSAFERHREQLKWELKAIPRKPLKIFLSSTLVRMFPRWPFIRRTSLRVIDCKEGRLLTKHFSFVNTNQSDQFRHFLAHLGEIPIDITVMTKNMLSSGLSAVQILYQALSFDKYKATLMLTVFSILRFHI